MALCVVLHDLPPAGMDAMQAAVWEVSESHWMLSGGMLVATSVSPSYLLSHLRQAVRRIGLEGTLIVNRVTTEPEMAWVDDAARSWVASHLELASAE
ncbi:hypothetical protein [Roseomonas xinghualingensis]|uniref:hypothetical protein n=1 Tax=Roseomonas xinghualingensis TaxID=2986475 RepID=UPI0021F23E75|nr:hypothetical protein [Roseomonas sp. SXEYE001]MCV4208656.1 hypothetical protein [Roseomonas sp. SXEYE001]